MPSTKTTATPHALIEAMLKSPQMGRAVRRRITQDGSTGGNAAAQMQLRILTLAADRQVWAYPCDCFTAMDMDGSSVDVDAFDRFDETVPANHLPV